MRATQLSGYRLMWIFVMFDLPVGTKEQSRAATKFREFLLDEGFGKVSFLPMLGSVTARNILKPICAGSNGTCLIAATFTSSVSRTANMKISYDFLGRADGGNAKTQINSRYSSDWRCFFSDRSADITLFFNAVPADLS